MNIGIITHSIPYGKAEGFIIDELLELIRQGHQISIFPMQPGVSVFHKYAKRLVEVSVPEPLFGRRSLSAFIRAGKRDVNTLIKFIRIILKTESIKNLIKNFAILPKTLFIIEQIKSQGIEHIHSYWASTSSTAAMMVSCATKIPWSMTCYRGDIQENNLLTQKYSQALFVRCHDLQGKREIIETCKLCKDSKLHVIRTGIKFPEKEAEKKVSTAEQDEAPFTFVVPGVFLAKKGHKYFIEAARILADKGFFFHALLIGKGPLEKEIRSHIQRLSLQNQIKIIPYMPLEKLRSLFRNGQIDAVVMPSIVTQNNQREGIPASLVEALASGIPVISTKTGGIPELLAPDIGILINSQEAGALADAMVYVINNPDVSISMSRNGRKRILKEFEVSGVIERLTRLMCSVQTD